MESRKIESRLVRDLGVEVDAKIVHILQTVREKRLLTVLASNMSGKGSLYSL